MLSGPVTAASAAAAAAAATMTAPTAPRETAAKDAAARAVASDGALRTATPVMNGAAHTPPPASTTLPPATTTLPAPPAAAAAVSTPLAPEDRLRRERDHWRRRYTRLVNDYRDVVRHLLALQAAPGAARPIGPSGARPARSRRRAPSAGESDPPALGAPTKRPRRGASPAWPLPAAGAPLAAEARRVDPRDAGSGARRRSVSPALSHVSAASASASSSLSSTTFTASSAVLSPSPSQRPPSGPHAQSSAPSPSPPRAVSPARSDGSSRSASHGRSRLRAAAAAAAPPFWTHQRIDALWRAYRRHGPAWQRVAEAVHPAATARDCRDVWVRDAVARRRAQDREDAAAAAADASRRGPLGFAGPLEAAARLGRGDGAAARHRRDAPLALHTDTSSLSSVTSASSGSEDDADDADRGSHRGRRVPRDLRGPDRRPPSPASLRRRQIAASLSPHPRRADLGFGATPPSSTAARPPYNAAMAMAAGTSRPAAGRAGLPSIRTASPAAAVGQPRPSLTADGDSALPPQRNRYWSPDEITRLQDAVRRVDAASAPRDWSAIAAGVGGARTGRQCRSQWARLMTLEAARPRGVPDGDAAPSALAPAAAWAGRDRAGPPRAARPPQQPLAPDLLGPSPTSTSASSAQGRGLPADATDGGRPSVATSRVSRSTDGAGPTPAASLSAPASRRLSAASTPAVGSPPAGVSDGTTGAPMTPTPTPALTKAGILPSTEPPTAAPPPPASAHAAVRPPSGRTLHPAAADTVSSALSAAASASSVATSSAASSASSSTSSPRSQPRSVLAARDALGPSSAPAGSGTPPPRGLPASSLTPTAALPIRHGLWTDEEDRLLLEATRVYGSRWALVAELVPGRNANQCSKRWHRYNKNQHEIHSAMSGKLEAALPPPVAPVADFPAPPSGPALLAAAAAAAAATDATPSPHRSPSLTAPPTAVSSS
ncbi:hypothetical protein CXG81DRAFT_28604 [Caulochytrium protostelioides]|uniref:Myb-like domain-containing protein n=1 Tax=Caulochytrium protostelioides TaxID=1555241 RepID=A0A4P9X0W5_9FUNG|nr:hypothetical protein CXG81DRAFT_28604 [Caulochytrium protostelioides]|eukprot:RKO98585.1 hypothetical protein CXG81DRAFT_28604 [Caulochytrium protostelioides]